jgi:hypothetical protein
LKFARRENISLLAEWFSQRHHWQPDGFCVRADVGNDTEKIERYGGVMARAYGGGFYDLLPIFYFIENSMKRL